MIATYLQVLFKRKHLPVQNSKIIGYGENGAAYKTNKDTVYKITFQTKKKQIKKEAFYLSYQGIETELVNDTTLKILLLKNNVTKEKIKEMDENKQINFIIMMIKKFKFLYDRTGTLPDPKLDHIFSKKTIEKDNIIDDIYIIDPLTEDMDSISFNMALMVFINEINNTFDIYNNALTKKSKTEPPAKYMDSLVASLRAHNRANGFDCKNEAASGWPDLAKTLTIGCSAAATFAFMGASIRTGLLATSLCVATYLSAQNLINSSQLCKKNDIYLKDQEPIDKVQAGHENNIEKKCEDSRRAEIIKKIDKSILILKEEQSILDSSFFSLNKNIKKRAFRESENLLKEQKEALGDTTHTITDTLNKYLSNSKKSLTIDLIVIENINCKFSFSTEDKEILKNCFYSLYKTINGLIDRKNKSSTDNKKNMYTTKINEIYKFRTKILEKILVTPDYDKMNVFKEFFINDNPELKNLNKILEANTGTGYGKVTSHNEFIKITDGINNKHTPSFFSSLFIHASHSTLSPRGL